MQPVYLAGVDIGGTKVAATIATREKILVRITEPTVKTGSVQALSAQVLALIGTACHRAGVPLDQVHHLGVSSCGPFVRVDGKIALATPNICGGHFGRIEVPNSWDSIPLEQPLQAQFQNVVIKNDCIAALIAERTFGAVRAEPDCIYATWSTGIGFALCVDGQLLNGKHGNAGHAGHMLMNTQSDALCGCGNRGDLEALISGSGMHYQTHVYTANLFARAQHGDASARATVVPAAQWFGQALYNLVVTLDTRVIVIGGGVWMHHAHWLAPIVQHEITSRFPALTQNVSIISSALHHVVTDIGALCLVMPTDWINHWRHAEPWQVLMVEFS